MIGLLRGVLLEKQPPFILIDVQGVGYEVEASMNAIFQLGDVGEEVCLPTHFIVREDAQLLFGFIDNHEKALFRELIKINGVGPKLALSIVSGMRSEALIGCIEHGDIATLVRLPGVGKKTAERLIIEMKDRLKNLKQRADVSHSDPVDTSMSSGTNVERFQQQEAESALIALGYKPVEAARLIGQISKTLERDCSAEELIKLALKSIVK